MKVNPEKRVIPFSVSFLADGKVTVETMGESNLFKGIGHGMVAKLP